MYVSKDTFSLIVKRTRAIFVRVFYAIEKERVFGYNIFIIGKRMPSYLSYLKSVFDAEWVESEHPRDDDGKFTDKDGETRGIESATQNTRSFVYEDGKVDLSGVNNPQNVDLMNEALNDVQKKYPFHLEEISTFVSRGVRLAQADGPNKIQVARSFINMSHEEKKTFYETNVTNYKSVVQNKINDCMSRYINNEKTPDIVKKKAQAQIKAWEKDLRYDRYNAISSPEMITKSIIYHEMGHILMFRNPEEASYLAQTAMNAAIATRDIYKISRYAATNRFEFFAECFSLKMQGVEIPSYAEKMIERIIKK